MKLNADFSKRVSMHAAQMDWVPSPSAGVERKMLDRIGDEVARATSIVRYAPGSVFPAHVHGGGEEYFVLSGVFQDEEGDHPAGTYVRNPPSSRHTPASAPGCTIFVKLWQFDPADRQNVRKDLLAAAEAGGAAAELFADTREIVRVRTMLPGEEISLVPVGGFEVFVLSGGFRQAGEDFGLWSWLRLPEGARFEAVAGPEGCRFWTKEGHMRFASENVPG